MNRYTLLARLLRRSARRLAQMARYRRLSLSGVPTFFANSFPKSGTHLLTQVMQGFTKIGPAVESGLPAIVTFEGDTGRQRDQAEILSDFHRLLPGDISYGHVHATPETAAFLCQPGIAPYFILRDPRDVAVSHVYYVTDMAQNHIHRAYYHEVLKSFDERLHTSIAGIPERGESKATALPNIRERFEPYLGWLDHPEVLVLHYEDFMTDRPQAIGRALDHAIQRGFTPRCNREMAIQTLIESIDPKRSPTFRSGKIGGWRNSFTPAHKALFKDIAGDLLIQLGYETGTEW